MSVQVAAATTLSGAASSAVAQTNRAPGYASIPGWDGELFRAVENLPWAAGPGPAERPVYVVYAPWCPACRSLAKAVVDGHGREVQTRWIAGRARNRQEAQHVAAVARTRDFALIARHMLSRQAGSDEADSEYVRRSNLIATAVGVLFKQRGEPTGVPTIIMASSGRLSVSAGYHDDFGRRWAARGPRGEAARSIANEYLTDRWTIERDLGTQAYHVDVACTVRLFPHDQALPMTMLNAGQGVTARRILGVRAERWVEILLTQNGMLGYIRTA